MDKTGTNIDYENLDQLLKQGIGTLSNDIPIYNFRQPITESTLHKHTAIFNGIRETINGDFGFCLVR